MSGNASTVLLLFLSALAAFGQSQPPPSFEVADVKLNKSGEPRMAVDFQPGGKLSMRNVPMKVMILMAYHVRPEAVTGGPGWLESDRFDVVAKAFRRASRAPTTSSWIGRPLKPPPPRNRPAPRCLTPWKRNSGLSWKVRSFRCR